MRVEVDKQTDARGVKLSVVICAHNPHRSRFERTLESLRAQTLPCGEWELVVVDNASEPALEGSFDWTWHPDVTHVVEWQLGLVHARVAGTRASQGEWCITVDDDTPLAPDYLEHVARIVREHPGLGIFGGRSFGEFETSPPEWLREFEGALAVKDRGEAVAITKGGADAREFPANAPILIAYSRKAFLETYLPHYEQNSGAQLLGRKGQSLASGEDNDITMVIYKAGFEVGYFPELKFTHIIPARRYEPEYLAQLLESSGRTWVSVLKLHGINPYPPIHPLTLPLRKLRAAIRMRAWADTPSRLRWKSSCGNLEGRADLWRSKKK